MEELLRFHIVSRGDELGEMPNVDNCVTFFKELFDNIDTETETGESPSKYSEPKASKTEPQTEPNEKKRSSIVILDDEEIEEFQKKSRSQRTLSKELSAARRLQAWYNDRYG